MSRKHCTNKGMKMSDEYYTEYLENVANELALELEEWKYRYYIARKSKNCYRNGYKHEKKRADSNDEKFQLVMEQLK